MHTEYTYIYQPNNQEPKLAQPTQNLPIQDQPCRNALSYTPPIHHDAITGVPSGLLLLACFLDYLLLVRVARSLLGSWGTERTLCRWGMLNECLWTLSWCSFDAGCGWLSCTRGRVCTVDREYIYTGQSMYVGTWVLR